MVKSEVSIVYIKWQHSFAISEAFETDVGFHEALKAIPSRRIYTAGKLFLKLYQSLDLEVLIDSNFFYSHRTQKDFAFT